MNVRIKPLLDGENENENRKALTLRRRDSDYARANRPRPAKISGAAALDLAHKAGEPRFVMMESE
jgi:hypothetical protein